MELAKDLKVSEMITVIGKRRPGEKHRLREFLIDKHTVSSATGTLLEEISEWKNKTGYQCPDCE